MLEYLVFHCIFFLIVCSFLLIYDKKISVFSPVFWYMVFHAIVFVIKPIIHFSGNYAFVFNYIGYYPSEHDLTKTLIITDTALTSFILGYYIKKYKTKVGIVGGNPYIPEQSIFRSQSGTTSLKLTIAITAPLILASLYQAGSGFSYDGSTGHAMQLINGISINTNTTGYITELKNMMTPLVFLMVVVFGYRRWVIAVIIAYTLYRLYLGWERIHLVALFISLILYSLMLKKAKWPPLKFAIIAITIIPLFSFLGENRHYFKSFLNDSYTVEKSDSRTFLEKQDNLDFANFEYLSYIVSVVPEKSATYSYWTQYLQIFTEPVPRIIWKDKPIGLPIKMVDLNDWGNFLGLTKSIIGDAWISLGYVGVTLNLFFIGYFLRFAFTRYFLQGGDYSRIVWLTILPFSLQLFRDGGIVSISKFLLFSLTPLTLWSMILKLKGKI